MSARPWQWALMLVVAAAVHALIFVAWPQPESGAVAQGQGGIRIGLGQAGGQPAAVSSAETREDGGRPEPEPEPEPEPKRESDRRRGG
jgi:hypothetical protein